jgi:ribosome biogenesis protein BRX1
MGELKMTGNCLKASRPFLSFDKTFEEEPHYAVIRELFTQVRKDNDFGPEINPFIEAASIVTK